MATKGIREIAITNDSNYLIEPTLYTTVNQTSAVTTFTADLDKFELFNGVTVAVKFGVTNNASATLNINGTGAKAIYYEGAAITASKLKAKHTYVFTYNGTQWELVGDLDTNTQSNYGNITTSGKIGTGNNLVVTSSGTVQAGATISSAISTQTTSTKFLREDGTWATPSYITNTDAKVAQNSNTEDKEFPIILKNTNNTTNETAGVKYVSGVTVNPNDKTVTANEFIGSLRVDRLAPINTKTYDAALYNSSSGENFYQTFATVTPADYNAIWIVSYRITITASGHSDYTEICDVSISGRANTYYAYKVYNSLVNYSIYQHAYLRSSSASTPHELGYRMQGSYGADSVQKVVKVELLEQNNCTVTLLDSLKMYANVTPSGYAGWTQITATSNGLYEVGDSDSSGYYIVSNGFKGKAGSNKVYRYCLFARTGDGTYESFVMQDDTVATTKTANPHGFVPDGKIYWNSNNTVYSEGTLNLTAYQQYHVIDYRYSFNITNTFLPDYCETYVVYTYNQDDGLLYLDTTQWLAVALPTSADGKIYQRIGSKYYTGTSNYYQGSLLLDNPYYEYRDGEIRSWNATNLSSITGANDLKAIEAISGNSGLLKKTAANTWTLDTNSYVTSSGITSVTIGATSPVQSSTSSAQTGSSASTTISLKDAYGDTKNPYGTKAKNLVLAGPSSGSNAAPSFRALVAADIPALAYVPATSGANDVNTLVNTGIYNITSGQATNAPKGYGYGQLLVMAYRRHTGNTTTDWASQIYLHNGVGTETGNATGPGNVLYYRTSNTSSSNSWFSWQKAVHTAAAYTKVGNTDQPVYIAEDGSATTITAVGAAYGGTGKTTLKDSANALINALDTGSSPLTANDYVITQYVGGGTTTTTYHRRPASQVVNGTLVKAALGTDTSTTTQWLNKKGLWSTPTAADVGAITKLSSSTDNAIVRFNGTSGQIQNSGVIIDDSNNMYVGKNKILNETNVPGQGEIILTALGFKTGYPVYTDPTFKSGTNSIGIYNNSGGGTVTHTRDTYTNFNIPSPGTDSNYVIKIETTGTASPGCGGFVQSISARANAQFIQIFRALVPAGRNLYLASNTLGTSYRDDWLTSNAGTGKWEWYARRVICGQEGTMSSGGHVYIDGSVPVIWYLASCNVYDITKTQYDGLRVRESDGVADYNNGTITTFGYSTSGMTSTSWLGSWDGYKLRTISPANAIKSGIGTTQIGGTTTPIYWTGSAFSAGTALSGGAYKDILNNTSAGALGWNSAGNSNANNLRLVNVNTLAYWNGAYSGTSSNLAYYKGGAFGTMAKETAADYAKLASPTFTGTPKAPTAANGTSTTQIATTEFVNNTLAYANAMTFKGTLGTGGTITALPASHNAGDTYRVITAGTWAGKYCEVGTLIICVKDGTAAADADWTSVETNEDGAVIGTTPTSSTDNAIVRWDGNSGRIIQDSGITIDDNNNIINGHRVQATYGFYSHQTGAENVGGFYKFATLTVSSAYVNRGIQISYVSRGRTGGTIYCIFANTSNTDPQLTVTKTGNGNIYYYKSATSTWDLYLNKTENYDDQIFSIINSGQLINSGVIIEWKKESVSTLPEGYSTAQIHNLILDITGNAATATAIQTAGTTAQFYRGDNSWSDTISGGTLKITNNSNTVTIGSQNVSFTHIYNSADIPFIFNKDVLTIGNHNLGSTSWPWGNLYIGEKGSRSIYYVGTKATNAMITFLDNTGDAYGNGIKIGGGGTVVIGAGESATNLSVTAGTETLYLISDGSINIEAGGDTIANRVGMQVTAAGHVIPVKAEVANNNAQDLGSSSANWANIYATTLHGNAETATRINGNLSVLTDASQHNIWVSSTNAADGIPKYISGVYVTASTGVITANGFSGPLSGNATSATSAGSATKSGVTGLWLYPENNNEINFGGTNTSTTIFFGYRAKDSRAIPTKFIFGGSTGTADLQAKTVYLGSGTTSYISSTQYTGNATSATILTCPSITTEADIGDGTRTYQGSGAGWTGSVTSMTYAGILQVCGGYSRGWQIWAQRGDDATQSLHWRNPNSAATAWNEERIILDSSNTTIPNTVPTLSWGADATVLTINGSAVKIKAMAKPTVSDIGAAAASHTHGNITNDGKMSGSTASGVVTTAHKFLREDGTWVVPKYTTDTDTHYTTKLIAGGSAATSNTAVTSGNVYLRLFDDNTHRNNIQFAAGSNMTITSDANGIITFKSSYTNNAVTHTPSQTTKYYLTGTSSSTTTTSGDTYDIDLYTTQTAGELSALRYSLHYGSVEKAHLIYNNTDDSIDFVFV